MDKQLLLQSCDKADAEWIELCLWIRKQEFARCQIDVSLKNARLVISTHSALSRDHGAGKLPVGVRHAMSKPAVQNIGAKLVEHDKQDIWLCG